MQEKKLEQCMVVMIVLVIVDINLQKEEKNASDKECPTTCELLRIEEGKLETDRRGTIAAKGLLGTTCSSGVLT